MGIPFVQVGTQIIELKKNISLVADMIFDPKKKKVADMMIGQYHKP